MHKNKIWIVLISILSILSSIFLFKAYSALAAYFQKREQIPVKIEKIVIEEIKKGNYFLMGELFYRFQDQEFRDKKRLAGPYQNFWAAENGRKRFGNQERLLWINPNKPKESVFIKTFPYKEIFSALILLGITFYFIILGWIYGHKRQV